MPKQNLSTKLALGILIAGHLLAAWFSFGFHHPDEHFQILEWAQYFVGLTPDASHLRWEFAAQIRPWFQPLLHAFFLKIFILFKVFNPFHAALFFRLVYVALNIASVLALWNFFKKKFALSPAWFLAISMVWFFPYVHVRTSSENLSGIFLSFALLVLAKNSKSHRNFFISGVLFGFAFLSRYQIALGLVGLALALLFKDRGIRKSHWALFLGFLLPVGLGVLLDRWGYGNWVFTPYRYFHVNITENMAATFNPYPWYQYLIWILELNPLISVPLTLGVFGFFWKNRKDFFATFTLAFFFLHWLITNKEYRFLFPILNWVPFLAAVYYQQSTFSFKKRFSSRGAWMAYAGINLLSFSASSLHGASTRTLWYVHAVHQVSQKFQDSTWISNRDLSKYHDGILFYDLKWTKGFQKDRTLLFQNKDELFELLLKHPNSNVLIDANVDPVTQGFIDLLEQHTCISLSRAYPRFLTDRFKLAYQVVYRCSTHPSLR